MDVIPCYRSEIVLVNDSSPDNVWNVIEGLAQKEKNVIGINLAKNFGQHSDSVQLLF